MPVVVLLQGLEILAMETLKPIVFMEFMDGPECHSEKNIPAQIYKPNERH